MRMLTCLASLLVVCGCASMESPGGDSASAYDESRSMVESALESSGSARAMPRPPAERVLIKTGNLQMTVVDAHKALSEVAVLLTESGGFEAGRQSSALVPTREILSRSEVRAISLTLKIPAARFEGFIEAVKEIGSYTSESTSAVDVTMQYVDLEARLGANKEVEKRLVAHLARAENVEGIVQVEKELTRVREQIESLTAQFKVLKDQVAFSTLTLELSVRPDWIPPAERTLGEDILDTLGGSVRALGNTARALLVYGLAFLPWLLVLACVGAALLVPVKLISARMKK
jgi:hypothetical protein